jgi:hypothetical protein
MSFHRKVLIGYVLFNVIFITLNLLNLDAPDRATDPDMISYGVAKYVAPAMLMVSSGVVVALLYALRGVVKVVRQGIVRWKTRG